MRCSSPYIFTACVGSLLSVALFGCNFSMSKFLWEIHLHSLFFIPILPRLYDVDRAAKFYQLIRYSYASGLESFDSQPHSMWSDFPMIDLAARRLQKVVIENKDFEKLIRQYDRPVSFFYCDPPYFATENYYKDVGFTAKDHIRLRDALLDIKGRFLVSYNDCPEIREIWHKPNIHIEEISRLNNLAQRYDGGCQYAELLISNYDTSERAKAIKQLSLFD